jgi:hypothetical protein
MNDGAPDATGTRATAWARAAEKVGAAALAEAVVSRPPALKENPRTSTSVKSLASLCDKIYGGKINIIIARTIERVGILNIVPLLL